jgi:ribosomal protein S18 acetylase RimI-like enzyme
MTNGLPIRKYTDSDKAEVIQLLRLNTPAYFSPGEEKDLIYYLDNYAENYYVVEFNKQILGCGGFNFSEDRSIGKISWDIFHPDHQGKGLGRALTMYRIEKLKEYDTVNTISVRTSQLVYKFYEKLGFELKEIVNDYWAAGFDLYRMEYVEKDIKSSANTVN